MPEEFESIGGAVAADGMRYRVEYMGPGNYSLYRMDKDKEGQTVWWGLGTIRPSGSSEKAIREVINLRLGYVDDDLG